MRYDSFLFLILLLCLVVFSCVPRKKLLYLQESGQQPSQSFPSQDQEYTLQPEDVIAVNIFSLTPGEFDIFGGGTAESDAGSNVNLFVIDQEGFVELPAIGDVLVRDLTIKAAQDKIRAQLQDYLRSPLVRITLQTPFEFTVLGEVRQPGRFTVVGEELTLLEALATAGDMTQFADRARIKIIRKKEDGTTSIAYVNVLRDDLLASENYFIQSEDIIIIDPLKARTSRENQLFVFSSVFGILSTLTFVIFNLTRVN